MQFTGMVVSDIIYDQGVRQREQQFDIIFHEHVIYGITSELPLTNQLKMHQLLKNWDAKLLFADGILH